MDMPINPNDFILMHLDSNNQPILKPGDIVFYDHTFKSNVATVALFEQLLSQYYLFDYVGGNRETGSFVHYKIKEQILDNNK